jgi:hypothetical protein
MSALWDLEQETANKAEDPEEPREPQRFHGPRTEAEQSLYHSSEPTPIPQHNELAKAWFKPVLKETGS